MTKGDLAVVKMQALGNDFIFLNGVTADLSLTPQLIRELTDRQAGWGCDQLIICAPPQAMQADFLMEVYNSDGSPATQCGNAARCLLPYVRQQGLSGKQEIVLETAERLLRVQLLAEQNAQQSLVRCFMGRADFAAAQVFKAGLASSQGGWQLKSAAAAKNLPAAPQAHKLLWQPSAAPARNYEEVYPVSFGNPHLIIFVASKAAAAAALEQDGELLATNDTLVAGANVGFVVVEARDKLHLRTYERGAGKTRACGSNACAAYATAYALGQVGERVQLAMPGGTALLGIEQESGDCFMESEVSFEFTSQVPLGGG